MRHYLTGAGYHQSTTTLVQDHPPHPLLCRLPDVNSPVTSDTLLHCRKGFPDSVWCVIPDLQSALSAEAPEMSQSQATGHFHRRTPILDLILSPKEVVLDLQTCVKNDLSTLSDTWLITLY